MKTNNILSVELPEIDRSVKECINQGQWLLFKSATTERLSANVVFYLKAGSSVFALDEHGQILQEIHDSASIESIDEIFYFSDIPKPHSLSNTSPLSFIAW